MESKSFQLSKADFLRILKGAAVAFAGALVVYIPEVVNDISWGAYAPLATAIAGVLVNTLRIWVADNTQK